MVSDNIIAALLKFNSSIFTNEQILDQAEQLIVIIFEN